MMTIPGVALADTGGSIVQRFWDSGFSLVIDRFTNQVPVVTQFLQQAETLFLGPDDDFTTNPAVQDVFNGMRLAGLMLLAFCTVISLAELTESAFTGSGYGLADWFKRFFVATIMTFGGLQFCAIWIRLFNALLSAFRGYLDTHWTGGGAISGLYGGVVQLLAASGAPVLLLPFVVLTVVTILILWFLIGGIRKAEMILFAAILAPLTWPVYVIPSLDDIPKTAFRSFLGLNATLLIVVGMLRLAVRLALGPGLVVTIWQLFPAMGLLVMTIFLPSIVKRVVGQGHTGVAALTTAVSLASGLKILSMGTGMGRFPSVAPPMSGAVPQAPGGQGSYPMAKVASGMTGTAPTGGPLATPEPPTIFRRARIRSALAEGQGAGSPAALGQAIPARHAVFDVAETSPGSNRFDVVRAYHQFEDGQKSYFDLARHDDTDHSGGE